MSKPETYVAFLRGVNVGGKAMIKMEALRAALTDCGLTDVRTHIQSGNVIFTSATPDKTKLGKLIAKCIKDSFKLDVAVAVCSAREWQKVIADAPKWWGKDETWKHNVLIMIEPFSMDEIVANIGVLKPDIEAMHPGNGVLYQSVSIALAGRATTGPKLISTAAYKQMTIRNYNTATKLVALSSQQ